jgi:restriction endonuclease Mrr
MPKGRRFREEVVVSVGLISRHVPVTVGADQVRLLRKWHDRLGEQIAFAVNPITAEAIYHLSKHPEMLYEVDPIRFEHLIARLLENAGYSVKITPATRDGGRDILAVLKIPFGEVLTIVDCKRFAANRIIGPELVQRLLWVSDNRDRASNAMLVTTSSFTSGARKIEQEYRWRLQLKEYSDIREWLCGFGKWQQKSEGDVWVPNSP